MTEKRPYWSHKRAAHLSRIDSALAITNGGDATNRRCAAVAGVGDPGKSPYEHIPCEAASPMPATADAANPPKRFALFLHRMAAE
jgi:hypothetical protein